MNPVFCVRNDRDDTLGITPGTLAQAGVPLMGLDAFDAGVRWPALEEISGLIVFGGEMNVDEVDLHPQLLTQRELMRRAADVGIPVLGICLGAQAWLRAAEPTLERVWKRTADEVRDELRMYLDAQQQRSRALLTAFAAEVQLGVRQAG